MERGRRQLRPDQRIKYTASINTTDPRNPIRIQKWRDLRRLFYAKFDELVGDYDLESVFKTFNLTTEKARQLIMEQDELTSIGQILIQCIAERIGNRFISELDRSVDSEVIENIRLKTTYGLSYIELYLLDPRPRIAKKETRSRIAQLFSKK